jgi:hypothetical protein
MKVENNGSMRDMRVLDRFGPSWDNNPTSCVLGVL